MLGKKDKKDKKDKNTNVAGTQENAADAKVQQYVYELGGGDKNSKVQPPKAPSFKEPPKPQHGSTPQGLTPRKEIGTINTPEKNELAEIKRIAQELNKTKILDFTNHNDQKLETDYVEGLKSFEEHKAKESQKNEQLSSAQVSNSIASVTSKPGEAKIPDLSAELSKTFSSENKTPAAVKQSSRIEVGGNGVDVLKNESQGVDQPTSSATPKTVKKQMVATANVAFRYPGGNKIQNVPNTAAAQETLVINKSEAGEGSQLNTPAASQLAATSNHAAAKDLSSPLKDAGQQELPEQNIAPKPKASKELTLEQFNSQLRPDSEKFVAQYSKIPILTGKKNYVIDGNEVREFVNNDDAKIYVASEERKAREQEFNNKVQEQNIESKREEQKKEDTLTPVSNLPESKKTLNMAAVNAELDKKGFGIQQFPMLKVSELSKNQTTSSQPKKVEGEHYGPVANKIPNVLNTAAQGSNNTPAAFNANLNAGIDGAAAEEQKNGSNNSLPKADQQVVVQPALAQDLVNNAPKKPVNQEEVGKGPSLQKKDVTPDVKPTDVSSGLQKKNDASEAIFQGVEVSNAERPFIDVLKDLTASQFENRFDGIRKVFRVQTERDKIVGKNEAEFAAYANAEEGKKVIEKVLEDKKNLEQLMRASIAEQKKVMENFGGQAIAPDHIKEKRGDSQTKTITISDPNNNVVLELEEIRDKNNITNGRNINFPTQLKEGAKGPVSLAFALLDKYGKRPPKEEALYFTLKYDESGKLVDMQMPQIVKMPGRIEGTPFVEVNNKVYSLPVNKKKLEELQNAIADNPKSKKPLFFTKQAEPDEAQKKFPKIHIDGIPSDVDTPTRANNQSLSQLTKIEEKHPGLAKELLDLEQSFRVFEATCKKALEEQDYTRTNVHQAYSAIWRNAMIEIEADPSKISEVKNKLQKQRDFLEIDIKISNPATDPKERTKEVHKAINGLQDYFDKLPDKHAKEQKKKFAKLKSKFDNGVDAEGNYDFSLSEEEAKSIMDDGVYKISNQQVKSLTTILDKDLGSAIKKIKTRLSNSTSSDTTLRENVEGVKENIDKNLQKISDESFADTKNNFYKFFNKRDPLTDEELKEFAKLIVKIDKEYPERIKKQQKLALKNLDRCLKDMDKNVNIDFTTNESKNNVQDPLPVQQVGDSVDGNVLHKSEPEIKGWSSSLLNGLKAIRDKMNGKTGGSTTTDNNNVAPINKKKEPSSDMQTH